MCSLVDPHARANVLGRLGMLMLADDNTLWEGLRILTEAYECSLDLGIPRSIAANGIRRATAMQYCGEHNMALLEFGSTLDYISTHKLRRLKDFALQHKGKCLVEMGQLDAADDCFRNALRLRRSRKATALVCSTLSAIKAVKSMRLEVNQC